MTGRCHGRYSELVSLGSFAPHFGRPAGSGEFRKADISFRARRRPEWGGKRTVSHPAADVCFAPTPDMAAMLNVTSGLEAIRGLCRRSAELTEWR